MTKQKESGTGCLVWAAAFIGIGILYAILSRTEVWYGISIIGILVSITYGAHVAYSLRQKQQLTWPTILISISLVGGTVICFSIATAIQNSNKDSRQSVQTPVAANVQQGQTAESVTGTSDNNTQTEEESSSSTITYPLTGQVGTVFADLPVASSPDTWKESRKALLANDETGVAELIGSGKAAVINAWTIVRVLDMKFGLFESGMVQMRILSGPHAGKKWWTDSLTFQAKVMKKGS